MLTKNCNFLKKVIEPVLYTRILLSYSTLEEICIVTCTPIARQRLGKRIPATHVHATIELLLLGNGAANMSSQQQKKRCFLCGPRHAF
jgi:hypothetical protein